MTGQRVEEIYRAIVARAPEHDVQPSTERVEAVLNLMGRPQDAYRVIHVAGTNGKTSTARMIESLVRAMGLRTGLFTSPHLSNVRERIVIDGQLISEEAFVQAWEDVAPFIEMVDDEARQAGRPALSFFEVFTVMAFAAFVDAPIDVAVLETGMGGRWDATNVVDAQVAVITPIGRDHERWLGHDIAQIAAEKAGILGPGLTAVIAEQSAEVAATLAQEPAGRVLAAPRDFQVASRTPGVGGQLLNLRTPAATYQEIFLPLFGKHQAANAAAALAATEEFFGGEPLPADAVEEGFATVRSPGRLEVVRSSPAVLVDAGHNPHGMAALREAVEEAFGFGRLVGVMSAMSDKNVEAMLVEIEPLLDELVVAPMRSERAMAVEELAEVAAEVFGEDRVHASASLPDALDLAATRAEAFDDPAGTTGVLVFGSVILAGEVRELFGMTSS